MKAYRIKNWQDHFENSESRKYKALRWVPVPNRQDGKGYRRLVAHPKSVQLFCAWNLIVQVASKTPARGVLIDEDGPISPSDLAFSTGFPEAIFELALDVFSNPQHKILWLETFEYAYPGILPEPPNISEEILILPVEEKRIEEKRKDTIPACAELNFSQYIPPSLRTPAFLEKWYKWVTYRKGIKKVKDWSALFREQLEWLGGYPEPVAIGILGTSIRNSYQGLFEPRVQTGSVKPTAEAQRELDDIESKIRDITEDRSGTRVAKSGMERTLRDLKERRKEINRQLNKSK